MEARAGESGHVTLRPADLGQALELELLCRLRLELFRELGKAGAGEEAQFLRACSESVRRFHAAGVLHAWLAWTEDGRAGEAEAVSGLMLLVFPRLPTPGNLADSEGYLLGAYTRPPWRRRGLMTGLLESALAAARRQGLARLRLHATPEGRAVYAAQGFQGRADEMERML
ncbi:MAG: GNAT family N-acetyltransferase [Planctomycetes bacterium]|nr:GNAT family N-acetyltransferase [Planctomycetota bacterium]